MPAIKRRPTPRRIQTLEALDAGELVRWGCGMPLVAGHCTITPGTDIGVWESWAELFSIYASVRSEYLEMQNERFPGQKPGIEVQFDAYRRGADPSAVVIDNPDPRIAWQDGNA